MDVAIDQGGCFETSKPTTHSDPIYLIDDIVHYCVGNMPGAVPKTSTLALTNATLSFALELANKSWEKSCQEDPSLMLGVNTAKGRLVCRPVAEAFNYECTPLEL